MTDLRQAAQQALEALEWHYRQGHSNTLGGLRLKIDEKALRNLKAALEQQAEPVAWDKPSASFNEWWDSYRHDPANPFAEGSAAYWAWAGWKSTQRQWVGLTDEEVKFIWKNVIGWGDPSHDDEDLVRAIEAKLKEKNT